VLPAPVAALFPPAAPEHAGHDCVAVPSFLAAAIRYEKQNNITDLKTNIFIIIRSRIALWATKITVKWI